MDESRPCIVCGAELIGPCQPKIALTRALSDEESEEKLLTLVARAWTCPGCGLVHWYADDEGLAELSAAAPVDELLSARPGAGYERRTRVLRMLRRIRRM